MTFVHPAFGASDTCLAGRTTPRYERDIPAINLPEADLKVCSYDGPRGAGLKVCGYDGLLEFP